MLVELIKKGIKWNKEISTQAEAMIKVVRQIRRSNATSHLQEAKQVNQTDKFQNNIQEY